MIKVSQLLSMKFNRVEAVSPSIIVYEAIEIMLDKNIGSLLVIESGDLVGIFTEHDYARKLVLQGKNPKDTFVKDVMSTNLNLITPEDTLDECMKIVTEKRIRHLPVIENGRLVGLLSIGDLVKAAMEEQELVIAQLKAYINT